jgi:hypothetical protein
MELSYPNPATDWVTDFGASIHTIPYPCNIHSSRPPSSAHPPSIIVGNGSILSVTSVGDSVLPGPLYLNEILVAPNLIQNLLSIRGFTTENSCSMEFDPFGLSVKKMAAQSVIATNDSSCPLYTIPLRASAYLCSSYPAIHPGSRGVPFHLASPPRSTWLRRPLQFISHLRYYLS